MLECAMILAREFDLTPVSGQHIEACHDGIHVPLSLAMEVVISVDSLSLPLPYSDSSTSTQRRTAMMTANQDSRLDKSMSLTLAMRGSGKVAARDHDRVSQRSLTPPAS